MPKKSTRRRKKKPANSLPEFEINPRIQRDIIAFLIGLAALIVLLSVFGGGGAIGVWIKPILAALFGVGEYVIPLLLVYAALKTLLPERMSLQPATMIGIIVLLLTLPALINVMAFGNLEAMLYMDNLSRGGGYVGLLLGYPSVYLLGFWGALFLLIALVPISVAFVFNSSLSELLERFEFLKNLSLPFSFGHGDDDEVVSDGYADEEKDEEEEEDEDEDETGFQSKEVETTDGVIFDEMEDEEEEPAPPPKRRRRKMPAIPSDLLETQNAKPQGGDTNARMFSIQKTLENFGIPVDMSDISVGPTVTQYTLKPADGIKLSRITSLSNDLALSLAAHPIRIEAPIPGKSLVGIEVPNQAIAVVTLREVVDSRSFKERGNALTFCLGKDVAGQPWVANLAKMPHLLVAGATGSGKTVCLNAIIVSLLYANSPDQLKLILIDPKRVELPVYNGIPHLLTPAITEVPKTINALKWAIGEMDRRFEILSKSGKRDIESFNESAGSDDKLPNIVIVIDELADLMVAAAAEVEAGIIRLAQMARAVGIHLIVATQRPSVDVITGLIKANIPARIAFSVASATDSRTILDTTGADKLVGRGDMLFQTAELSRPKRIQCCYVSDREIRRVVDFLKSQLEEPIEYNDDVTQKRGAGSNGVSGYDDDDDELYEEAKMTVIRAGKASASYLQRRLKVGYARAARLLDLLEERGIIGPGEGAKPREILVNAIADEDGLHIHEEEE